MHFWLIDFSKMPYKRSHNGVFYNPTIRMRDGKVGYVLNFIVQHRCTSSVVEMYGPTDIAFRNDCYLGLKWYILFDNSAF